MAEEAIETTEAHSYDCYSDYSKRLAVVNQGIRFTDVRGKAYAEVNQRILAFWALFPNGRIVTRKIGDTGNRVDFECDIYRDAADELPAVNAHAFEDRNTTINKTSYVENGETSVIGRALGMLGIGATTAIASADEVLNAIAQQEATKANSTARKPKSGTNTQQRGKAPQKQAPAAQDQRKQMFGYIAGLKAQAIANGVVESGIDDWFAANFGGVGLNRLTEEQLYQVIAYLEQIVHDSSVVHEAFAEQDASNAEANQQANGGVA